MSDTITADLSIERQALNDANGNGLEAIELLVNRVLAEPRVVGEEQLLAWAKAWAAMKIYGLFALDRRVAIQSSGNFSLSLISAMNSETSRMMETPIFGGKLLKDATVEEVRESSRRYSLLAQDTAHKARWQQAIADAVERRGGNIVSEVMIEADLVQLWEESGE